MVCPPVGVTFQQSLVHRCWPVHTWVDSERTSPGCYQNAHFQTTQVNGRLTFGSLTLCITFEVWEEFVFRKLSDGMPSRGDDFLTTFGTPTSAGTDAGGRETGANLV